MHPIEEIELDALYKNRFPEYDSRCERCWTILDPILMKRMSKFMGEKSDFRIYAMTCPHCREIRKVIGCDIRFLQGAPNPGTL